MLKIFPDKDRFNGLKENNAFIPIYTSLSLTTETPLEIFEKLFKASPFSFLFHSGRSGSENSRYSFLGTFHNSIKGNNAGDLLKQLQSALNNFKSESIDYLPHFWGGAVGYFSYDIARHFERIPTIAADDLNLPEIYIGFTDEVIVFDHDEKLLKVIVSLKNDKDYEEGVERLKKLVAVITSHQLPVTSHKVKAKKLKSNMAKAQFAEMVKRVKEYIKEGDIFQANLSQRFEADFEDDSWEFYKRLNEINPSPFGGYINFDDMSIVSASPERLIKINGKYIETRPIAGTRPRGRN
ncbi:MAG: chorismate-binding protein, partial [Nitrospinota bacterium]